MNIFLTGHVQIGKSTVLKKVLDLLNFKTELTAQGFITFHHPNSHDLYISAFNQEKIYDNNHKVASYQNCRMYPDINAFNKLGTELLEQTNKANLIIMDELGFLEKEATIFQKKVFELLNSPKPCFGVLRKAEIPWQKPIYKNANTLIIEVTAENRDKLPYDICNLLENKICK